MAANASTDAGSTTQSNADSRSNTDSNSVRFNDSDSEHGDHQSQDDVGPVINEKFLKELMKKEWKLYYRTFELNEKLFLHCKGK